MPGLPQLRRLELSHDGDNSDESARQLCFALFPKWETEPGEIELKHFTDGITNTLLKVTKIWPGATPVECDQESVLIRAYGRGTEVLIDREREITTHHLLALHNLAPELVARFQNGMIYRFVPGRPCGPLDMRVPRVYRGMAQKIGEWHAVLSVSTQTQALSNQNGAAQSSSSTDGAVGAATATSRDGDNSKGEDISGSVKKVKPNIWTIIEKWINVLPARSDEERTRNETFRSEFRWIVSEFARRPGLGEDSLVVGHGDLLCANMIILPSPPHKSPVSGGPVVDVALIDYEYATPCQAAFDLACHFAEWIGFECDYNGIPGKADRREFLAEYLHSYRRHSRRTSFNHLRDEAYKVPLKRDDSGEYVPQVNGSSTSAINGSSTSIDEGSAKVQSRRERELDELDRLCNEVDHFRGLPGFYWGIWAYIQASISAIDFDYDWYGKTRMQEYWDWKAEVTGSRQKEGHEMPLREKRWNSD